MRKKQILSLWLIIVSFLFASEQKGIVEEISVTANSLIGNVLDSPTEQSVAVYLPPGYDKKKEYPTLYFLPGFGVRHTSFLNGRFYGFNLSRIMDSLIAKKAIPEMIVVIPNGLNSLAGSYYVNSAASGDWENYITEELVNHIDNNYSTIKKSSQRAISGHSMGGFGALHLAFRHPDIFGSVFALSPGLFDEKGLVNSQLFNTDSTVKEMVEEIEFLSQFPKEEAIDSFTVIVERLITNRDFDGIFAHAYGVAFSPSDHPPYINYPYVHEGDSLKLRKEYMDNYYDGFGNWETKLAKYDKNITSLKLVGIDYGLNEQFVWIMDGCKYLSEKMKKYPAFIELNHDGDHSSKIVERFAGELLPRIGNTFSK